MSIRVELVEGRGDVFWPRPGRVFAASRTHTFGDLASAIDDAFARWDRAHLHQFWLADGRRVTTADDWDDFGDDSDQALDDRRVTLGTLGLGEEFAYEFDFGDGWRHLCAVGDQRIDPLDELGIVPVKPLPYWGWGAIPDQYGRRWPTTTARTDRQPTPRARICPRSDRGNGGGEVKATQEPDV